MTEESVGQSSDVIIDDKAMNNDAESSYNNSIVLARGGPATINKFNKKS